MDFIISYFDFRRFSRFAAIRFQLTSLALQYHFHNIELTENLRTLGIGGCLFMDLFHHDVQDSSADMFSVLNNQGIRSS